MLKKISKHSLVALCIFLFCNNCANAQKDVEQISAVMEKWKQAIVDQDIDAIVTYYSEDFTSDEAEGKEGVRGFWEEVKKAGMIEKLDINLETAQLEVTGDSAEFIILDDNDERMMAFILEKTENKKNWLITGTPPEVYSYEKYSESYGDDCIQHGGFYRCWNIKVPPGLKSSVPLVIDLHGWESTPSEQRSISGFDSLAASEGFIVAWPYGIGNSWNSGKQCCEPANEDEIDDVGFIRKLITQVSEKNEIDLNSVYVTGLSNGCAMTQRLANEASDVIAAAACMSLHLLVPEDPEYTPISVMTLLGTNDDLYEPGEDGMPGAKENFETWKMMNNCSGTPEETWSLGNSVALTYQACDNGTEVTLVSIDGGGHILYPGAGTEINTTRLAWDFMKRFSKD